jgi:transcriptional regulator with XRE-family HTH domain
LNLVLVQESAGSDLSLKSSLKPSKLGVLIQEARKQQNLTQEELALKSGTTKSYISRIENDASDIRLSTLMRIIREGLGGQLKLSVADVMEI